MEVLISFFVLAIGLTGSLSIIVSAGKANKTHQNRLIATNLAQESLEAIRNIRDTNWLVYSSNLRECWNFWPDTDENGIIDASDAPCVPNTDGQNDHPIPGGQSFLVDFDPDNFQWNLVPASNFSSSSIDPSKDFSGGFSLFKNAGFFTHNRGNPTDSPTAFSREIKIYYLDNPNFVDNGDGTFSGGDFPVGDKSKDNRILVISRVSWEERGATRSVVLSTIFTDFLARTEWNS